MVFVLLFFSLLLHGSDEQFKQLPKDILQFAVSTSDFNCDLIAPRNSQTESTSPKQFGDSGADDNARGRHPTPAKTYFWNFVFCTAHDLGEDDCRYWVSCATSKPKVNVIVPPYIQLSA